LNNAGWIISPCWLFLLLRNNNRRDLVFDILRFSKCGQRSDIDFHSGSAVHFATALVVNCTNVNVTQCFSSNAVGFSCLSSSEVSSSPTIPDFCSRLNAVIPNLHRFLSYPSALSGHARHPAGCRYVIMLRVIL
jgi:hypothetical protein